jgi:hypothetical protein
MDLRVRFHRRASDYSLKTKNHSMLYRTRTGLFAVLVAMAQLIATPVSAALSDFHYDVQVTDIEIVNDGTNNAIYVRGGFTPALPCAVQGFVFYSSDPYQKEISALLLTAKATGRSASFVHAYCISSGAANGYGRGNGYSLK